MATIRFATDSDAPDLARVGEISFTETFGHLYPLEDLNDYLSTAHTEAAYLGWIANPAYDVWVAEHEGEVVGYALTGPCDLPHAEVTPDCGELKRLYLLEKAHNQGIGGQLLKVCLVHLTRPGRRLWIGVWSENYGAQRLYGRYGFEKVGEYTFPVGKSRDHEFILSRPA
jgi:ribosomal protein S18 acetylase RimI-like enzyme